jgi:P27 family predicted phage terminase small subunit
LPPLKNCRLNCEIIVKAPTKAPQHLTEPTRAWWRQVVRDFQLDAHHLKLLQAACEAWDRACEAQSILSRDGLIIAGREGGVRPHPAVAIRRDAEISFARLLRELDLDTEPPSGLRSAPPSLRSNRRGL